MSDENTLSSSDYGKYVLGLTTELENRYDFITVEHFDNINKDLFEIAAVYGEKYIGDFNALYEKGAFNVGTMILRNDTYLLDENGDYELGITGEREEDYRVSTFSITDLYSEPTMAFLGDYFLTGRLMGICHSAPSAYFLGGHGDISLKDDSDLGNAELLADVFMSCGYHVEKIDLSQKNFPDDAKKGSVAVIFAPRIDLTEAEIERLNAFVSNGGHVMSFADGTYYRLDKLNAFLESYGITVANAKIKSGSEASLGDNGFMFAATVNADAACLQNIRDKEAKMVLSSCRLLRIDESKGAEALLTPPLSYTAVGIDTELSQNDAAVAISRGTGRGSVFVSGGETLASSFVYSPAYNNRNLLLSVLIDMGAEDVPLNVDVKTLDSDGLDLTKGQATAISLVVSLVPALVVTVLGTVVYVRRKRS